jgi:hypothetical protein
MTMSTYNPNTSYAENTIVDAEDIHIIPASTALQSGSLTASGWDDELLPSGD